MAMKQKPMNYTSIPNEASGQTQSRLAYASFGNEGVTATVNAHGHLIQVTRYFGNGLSGFICVELPKMPSPYFIVSRMACLQSHIKSPEKGMRLEVERDANNIWKMDTYVPKMEFLHDRWPRFTTATGGFNLNIEYRIHKNTVYQVYTYKIPKKLPDDLSNVGLGKTLHNLSYDLPYDLSLPLPPLAINVDLFFRQLDFTKKDDMKSQHPGNDYPRKIKINDDHDTIRICQATEANQAIENVVSLCISLFINGRVQNFHETESEIKYRVLPDETARSQLEKNKEIQIAIAYSLELFSESVDNIEPVSFKNSWGKPKKLGIPFDVPLFIKDKGAEHLNFVLRRNLEHILSVCSIPVTEYSSNNDDSEDDSEDDGEDDGEDDNGIPPIALTCGDLSGHRITTAASFYAFQFLLKAFKYFEKEANCPCTLLVSRCRSYNCRMRSRIWTVCYGHVKWLYENMKLDEEEKFICPHYWASGEVIVDWKGHPLLRGRSLTDTPFHVIKAAEFYNLTKDKKIRQKITDGIRPIVENWIRELDKRNMQGKYAFPHFREEPTHIFYFSDHVMIWRALKSAEDLGWAPKFEPDSDSNTTQGQKLSYSSTEVKTNMLKRFTTKNILSKERMLAVLRSPSETKFLFETEDTVLFHAIDLGLFAKSGIALDNDTWKSKIQMWKNMINFQMRQFDNDNIYWIQPLQFALAMMISAKNKGIDSMTEATMAEMFDYSKSILLRSSSRNGLFPGQLDENKEPKLFSDELDSELYFYTAFEIPYILWNYQRAALISPVQKDTPGVPPSQHSVASQTATNTQHRESLVIEKNTPFDDIIDSRNIMEYADEWMYNEPAFFKHECNNLQGSVEQFIDKTKEHSHEQIMHKIIESRNHEGEVEGEVRGYLIDVPKTKSLQNSTENTRNIFSRNSHMYKSLKIKRSPENAKKRLLYFSRANPKTALICYLASPEQDEISSFFNRHTLYDKYFFEEITPILNTWVTELHLSFYRIVENDPSKVLGISPSDEIVFPHKNLQGKNKWISRAVMSFRFDGDVFDRNWTCHVLECEPQREKKEGDLDSLKKKPETAHGSSKSDSWKQRQVLELLIFDEILQEMLQCTQKILQSVKDAVLGGATNPGINAKTVKLASPLSDPLDLFGEINGDVYKSTTKLWRKFHHILQVVEDDLAKNITKIGHWKNRQTGREYNRPRWTLKDERGYRGAISKLLASNDQKVLELERCYADIESFKMLLAKRLEITRGDLDLRRADDLRMFTYVTVIFLPIGFATAMFSMSNAPPKEVWSSMAITASLALLFTTVMLFSAPYLAAYFMKLFSQLRRLLLRNKSPEESGNVASFLERLDKFTDAIGKALKDLFSRRDMPQPDDVEKVSVASSQTLVDK